MNRFEQGHFFGESGGPRKHLSVSLISKGLGITWWENGVSLFPNLVQNSSNMSICHLNHKMHSYRPSSHKMLKWIELDVALPKQQPIIMPKHLSTQSLRSLLRRHHICSFCRSLRSEVSHPWRSKLVQQIQSKTEKTDPKWSKLEIVRDQSHTMAWTIYSIIS